MKVDFSKATIASITGVYVTIYASGAKQAKENLIAHVEANGGFPLTITFPCGQRFVIDDAEAVRNMPEWDIPCMCGDPTHWFVRWNVDG